jgi:hypothetical protein
VPRSPFARHLSHECFDCFFFCRIRRISEVSGYLIDRIVRRLISQCEKKKVLSYFLTNMVSFRNVGNP